MKILYITTVDLGSDSGVRKKIYGQIEAMRKGGLVVELIGPKEGEIVVKKKEDQKKAEISLGQYSKKGLLRFFKLAQILYKKAYENVNENDFDAVFIRYSLSEYFLLSMLKKLKKDSVAIFMEIPSYPYDLEYDNKQYYKRIGLYIDRIFRKNLKKYVDIIFTPSPKQKDIYGIRTEFFNNAVNTKGVNKRKYQIPNENVLRFIGVANLNAWHGYDRIIRGIAKYYEEYSKVNFIFNIVGDGLELPNLKRITEELNLEEKIIFDGKKYGGELDQLYENSDVAISSIGFFRLDSIQRTSLKTREACLKSIPFVAVKGDPVFDDNFDYAYFVEDEDTPIDVKGVYNWFKMLNPDLYLEEMYNFGKKYLSWEKNMEGSILIMKNFIKNDK